MNPYVLNRNFEVIRYLDSFASLEWVNRYQDTGDFVLVVPASAENVSDLQPRHFLVREDDEMIVMIEKVEITTDAESGDYLTVSGRSIESILGRRIVWTQTNANTSVELFLRTLVYENCINPTDPKRRIPNLILGEPHGFTERIEKQVTGDNLLDVVRDTCQTYGYGFRIYMNADSQLVFDVYKGEDRSYNQTLNSYVSFTPSFENIINSTYTYDEELFSNVALVGGEGEGMERVYTTVGEAEGYDRYEVFVDARDVSTNSGAIDSNTYLNMLAERGQEKIALLTSTESMVGEVETSLMYRYKEHYYLGDVVSVENGYGVTASPRIIAMIESENESGYKAVPEFGTLV